MRSGLGDLFASTGKWMTESFPMCAMVTSVFGGAEERDGHAVSASGGMNSGALVLSSGLCSVMDGALIFLLKIQS